MARKEVLVSKLNDKEYLKILISELPRENFDDIYFIQQVKMAAQDIRKLEQNQCLKGSRKKIVRPDKQKNLVKNTLKNKAYALYDILRSLPDDCAMRIDNQHVSSGHESDEYIIMPRAGFTEVAREVAHQLIDYCDKSYELNNQGWRNLYKTQESRIALAWRKSGAKLSTTVEGPFFKALCNFRNYCQVDGYSQDQVSPTEIRRIMNQLS